MLLKELEFKICNLSTIFLTITAGEPSSAAQHSKTARDVGSGTWRWSRVKMLDRLIRLKIRNIYIYIWVLYDMYNIYIIYTYMIHIYIYASIHLSTILRYVLMLLYPNDCRYMAIHLLQRITIFWILMQQKNHGLKMPVSFYRGRSCGSCLSWLGWHGYLSGHPIRSSRCPSRSWEPFRRTKDCLLNFKL